MVSERDLHSRSSSEFLRERIRQISSPSHPIFFFFFFFDRVTGLLHVFSFYVTGVLGEDRRNAMMALNDFISSTLTLSTRSIFYVRDIRLHLILSWFIEISNLMQTL